MQQIQSSLSAFAAVRRDGCVVTWGDAVRGGDSSQVFRRLGLAGFPGKWKGSPF